jgi:hypothetical protein
VIVVVPAPLIVRVEFTTEATDSLPLVKVIWFNFAEEVAFKVRMIGDPLSVCTLKGAKFRDWGYFTMRLATEGFAAICEAKVETREVLVRNVVDWLAMAVRNAGFVAIAFRKTVLVRKNP